MRANPETAATSDLVARAEAAADLVQADAAAAEAEAQTVLAAAAERPEAAAIATWVLGLVEHERNAPAQACTHFGAALELTTRHGLDEREGRIRTSRALSLYLLGEQDSALDELTRAEAMVSGWLQARVRLQRGIILIHSGRLEESVTEFDRAEPGLAGHGPDLARLGINRGVAHLFLGNLRAAERDLVESRSLATDSGLAVIAAGTDLNLGYVMMRRGDIPAALEMLGAARDRYIELGGQERSVAILDGDLSETLLAAGLVDDALVAADRSLELATAGNNTKQAAEARLLRARSCLAAGDCSSALREAGTAAESFREAGRGPWAALAEYVALQARVVDGAPASDADEIIGLARKNVEELARNGWRVESIHLQTQTARLALEHGRERTARRLLEGMEPARRRGTAALRAQAWYVTALARLADGNRKGALRALDAGLRVVEEHRNTLGATELLARSAIHGVELAELGLELAFDAGRPERILEWNERCRSLSFRSTPARPPDDEVLAADLAELRVVDSNLRTAKLDGRAEPSLEHRRIGLEQRIRDRTRLTPGAGLEVASLDPELLRTRLAECQLVEFVVRAETLFAIVVTQDTTRLETIGPYAEIGRSVTRLRAAQGRVATTAHVGGSRAPSAEHALVDRAGALDAALFPARMGLDARHVVIVPTRDLHDLPWALLSKLDNREVTIAPSAQVWAHGRDADVLTDDSRVVLVAGPGLSGAEDEVARIARHYREPTVLTGAEATVAATLEALRNSDVAHLAAHGNYRSDNPLFSSIELADGLLVAYDVERLPSGPATVVLSACEAGTAEIATGDELLGAASALVRMGVVSVVAPLAPVPDHLTVAVMDTFHRELAGGASAAAALAASIDAALFAGPAEHATAASFICFGSDGRIRNREQQPPER